VPAPDLDLFGEPVQLEPERPEREPETRGQQIALLEWCGLEHETFKR
jgi:hypothetical protein